jgi:hypothetical protein
MPYNQLTTKPIGITVINAYLIDLKVTNSTKKEATAAIGIDLYNEFVAEDSSTSLTNGEPVTPYFEI